jgi:hypothetical protein
MNVLVLGDGAMKGLWMAAIAVAAASAAAAQPRPAPTVALTTFRSCFDATLVQLEASHPTPERYQLAMEGACLTQEEDALKEFEQYLMSWDQGHRDVTSKSMQDLRGSLRNRRLQRIGEYAARYEPSDK